MILTEGTRVALVRLAASVGGAFKAGVADTFKPYVVALTGAITKPPLKKCPLCCLLAKRQEIFSGEFALHQHEGVDVPVWGVIIMQGSNELNLFAQALFQGKHGVDSDIS